MVKSSGGMPSGIKTILYWVLGIGIIALVVLIMLILFGNLSGNVGFGQDSSSFINNTMNLTTEGGVGNNNATDITGKVNPTLSSIILTNRTSGATVPATNYTIGAGIITINTPSDYNGQLVNASGTLGYDEQAKIDTDNLITNYSLSAKNIGKQLPITGTIIGVGLLLIILLAVLVLAIRRIMSVGGSSGGTRGGGSSKFLGSSSAEIG